MKRKKVGLALGSGAARGFAHLGVLQVLEEEGITVDFVSGCSIGALIGALYCSGMTVEETIELAENMEPWQWMDFYRPRKGLISGDKIENMIKKYTEEKTFEELEIPLSIIATDLNAGERYVFDKGPVYRAVRASISIPGIFRPVEMEDRLLVDGAVVDSIPVELVRNMGAKVVIGVNLGSHFTERKIENIYQTIIQSIDIMQNEIKRLRGIKADVLIEPNLKDVNPTNFRQVKKCVEEGRKAAEDVVNVIKQTINPSPGWGLLKNLDLRKNI